MTAAFAHCFGLLGARLARIAHDLDAWPAARPPAVHTFEPAEAPPLTVDLTLLSCISSVKQEGMQGWVALWGAWVKPRA